MRDITIDQARAALVEIAASGGPDLRGYEHIFGVCPEILANLGLADREIQFLVAGTWQSIGICRSMNITQRDDMIDVTHLGSRPAMTIRVSSSIEVDFSIAVEEAAFKIAMPLLSSHAKVPFRTMTNDMVLEAEIFFTQYEVETGPSGTGLVVSALVSGEPAYKEA